VLALRQSESRNCGLHFVYMESGGATLLVGTWQTSRRKRNGQFTLSTQLINPKFCVLRPHRRSTTVSDLRDSVCVCVGGGEGGYPGYIPPGAIIGDGDRKRGVHAAPSKKTNVLFLEKIAPPSTS